MGHVFISYSSKNQSMANSMRQLLGKHGISTWMAPDSIPAGKKYGEVITRAIKDCACVLLILSDAAQKSIWVPKEIERAVSNRKPVIPLQIEDVKLNDELELYISTSQIIHLPENQDAPDVFQKLINAVCEYTGVTLAEGGISEQREDCTEEHFKALLEQLFGTLYDFQAAVSNNNNPAINEAIEAMGNTVQQIKITSIRTRNTHHEISQKADAIVERYHSFADKYTGFILELRRGRSEKSEQQANAASIEFGKLYRLVEQSMG